MLNRHSVGVILILASCCFAKEPNPSDYPLLLAVVRSGQSGDSVARGGTPDVCWMWVGSEKGMAYRVVQESVPLRWKFCTTYDPGSKIHARIKGYTMYFLIRDRKGKLKQDEWVIKESALVKQDE
jgi:hypothetical protein